MKTFEISGTFEAQDIDDALKWLGRHFSEVAAGIELPADRYYEFKIGPKGGDEDGETDPA